MVQATILPLPDNTSELGRFTFNSTIKAKSYRFEFLRNNTGDYWSVKITRPDTGSTIFSSKIVMSMRYAFPNEGWGIVFHDFSLAETNLTGASLGRPAKAVLFDVVS